MPGTRHARTDRTLITLGVAAVVAALIAPAPGPAAAGAAPSAAAVPSAASAATPMATVAATPMATASAVRAKAPRARLTEVPLSGVDQALAESSPDPQEHDHGTQEHDEETQEHDDGTVGALSTTDELTVAVAARVKAAKPATLIGVTADRAFEPGTSIQVRVKERKHGWSKWTTLPVDPEHGPDPGSVEAAGARPGSDPLTATNAVKVKVRIDTPSGRVPRGTELALVAAPAAAADSRTGRVSTLATVGRPSIVTRAQWGADESWRNRAPYYTDNIRAGFIHHTASTSNYSASQAAAQVRAIYAYHTRSLGHSDIDYNFLVDRFGQLYEGRYGGMDRPVLGGHTAGFNEHTFAAVALGNFESFAPASAQKAAMNDSLARLFAWKLGLSGVNPTATVNLVSAGFSKPTRYPRGSVATLPAISSHRMVNYTACPGKNMQAQLPAIRALAGGYSDVVVSAPTSTSATFRADQSAPVTLASYANRAVTWTADVLSPCSDTPVRSFTGATAGAGQIDVRWDLKDSKGAAVLPATYTVRMSGTAADGTPVAEVSSRVTITPAPGGAWGPCANASRVAGDSTPETSVLWGRISAPNSSTIVLTGAADAGSTALAASVAAGPLARVLKAPLLVTSAGSLHPDVAAEITSRRASEVIIVGSTSVVSDSVAASVGGLGARVTRLAGSNNSSTAAAVAERMGNKSSAVLVYPGGAQAHALTGSALAAARGVPALIAGAKTLPVATVAALAGRSSFTVVAPASSVPDSVISAGAPGVSFDRIEGVDEVAASLAVGAAFGAKKSAMILPDTRTSWGSASLAAAAGVPLLFTTSPVLSPDVATFISGRSALRATTTSVSDSRLDDRVLGATSRVLLGQAWAPPAVTSGSTPTVVPAAPAAPTATSKRKVKRTNATPEPVKKRSRLKVKSKVRVKYSDGSWRAVPAGVSFKVQFKPKGGKYKKIASGKTKTGKAQKYVKAKKSGRFRIKIGKTKARWDYVRVKK